MGAEGQPKLDGPRTLVIHANKVMATEGSPVNWTEWVEINPTPGELKWQSSGSTATATGSFALGIEYNVRVKSGLTAADGTVLAQAAAYRVTFAPHAPHLSLPAFDAPQWLHGQAEFAMSSANLQGVDLTVKRVPPELAPLALRGYGAYEHQKQDGSLTAIPLPAVPGRTVLRKSLPSAVKIDQSERFGFTWAEAGGGQRQPGLYFVNAEGSCVGRIGWREFIRVAAAGRTSGDHADRPWCRMEARGGADVCARLFAQHGSPRGRSAGGLVQCGRRASPGSGGRCGWTR
jgi:hypothetical protein